MLTFVMRTTDKKEISYPLLLVRATIFHIWLTLRSFAAQKAACCAYAVSNYKGSDFCKSLMGGKGQSACEGTCHCWSQN